MTKMKNKELVNKFIDVINKRNLAVLDELLAADFILHGGSRRVPY
jgi:ketosteroid isomerase-like protein